MRQFNDSTLIEKVELNLGNCGRRRVSLDDGKGRRWRDYLNLLLSVAFACCGTSPAVMGDPDDAVKTLACSWTESLLTVMGDLGVHGEQARSPLLSRAWSLGTFGVGKCVQVKLQHEEQDQGQHRSRRAEEAAWSRSTRNLGFGLVSTSKKRERENSGQRQSWGDGCC